MRGTVRQPGRLVAGAAFTLAWNQSTSTAFATDVSVALRGTPDSGKPMDMLDVMFLFLFLAIVPSLVIAMTSSTRIIAILSFLRNTLGAQQSPLSQILVGPTPFLTLSIMNPMLSSVNTQAYQPYKAGTITREAAFERAWEPIKESMLKQTEEKSLDLFLSISKMLEPDVSQGPEGYMKLGLVTLVPSLISGELNKTFTMGFLISIPFLIVDLVVSSTLMSVSMVMLPPTIITLPFKIVMFVLVDGRNLMIKTLVQSFRQGGIGMNARQVMEIVKEAMLVAFETVDPLLIVSTVVGLLMAIFQAATQVHEQMLAFVPKLLVIALVLLALGPWMSKVMNEFAVELFAIIAAL